MDTRELEQLSYRPKTELFLFPLAAFLLTGLAYHGGCALLGQRRTRRASNVAAASLAGFILPTLGLSAVTRPTGFLWQFHFLRPAWLLALIPIGVVIWLIFRRQSGHAAWQNVMDAHLLEVLLVRPESGRKFRPVHLLALAWSLTAVALAGPTWQREPSPFTDDEAAIVITMAVTPSMLAQDIQPSRLKRSVHKIRDLLALRSGTSAALVAYAGSAHLVMPITQDAEIIETFAAELDPEIMPKPGDAVVDAIAFADQILSGAGRPGSILLITDRLDLNQDDARAIKSLAPVNVLAVAGDQTKPLPLGSPPAPALDREALASSTRAIRATLTIVTPDDTDVQAMSRHIDTSFVAAQQDDGQSRWMDMGYWMTPWIALLTLLSFRPGWVVKWN